MTDTSTYDVDVPYEEVLLFCHDPAGAPNPVLPAGYSWDDDPLSRRDEWAHLMTVAGFPFSLEEAYGFWDSMADADRERFGAGLSFVVAPDGSLAAACGLWTGRHFDPPLTRIHWVMTHPDHRRLGLSRACCLRAMKAHAAARPDEPIYLSTQSQSWAAILMYEKMGFVPYLGESDGVTAEEASARWQRACDTVRARHGVEI